MPPSIQRAIRGGQAWREARAICNGRRWRGRTRMHTNRVRGDRPPDSARTSDGGRVRYRESKERRRERVIILERARLEWRKGHVLGAGGGASRI